MRRGVVLALGMGALLIIGGVRAFGGRGGTSVSSSPAAVTSPATAEAPATDPLSTDEFGVPHGWSQDRDGAVAAAVSAVRLTGPIAKAGFITRTDMIASLATERFAPALASESADQLAAMIAELGEASVAPAHLLWSEIPLTARIVTFSDYHARVAVWSVLVFGVPEIGAPRQAWRTGTIDLLWEEGDWRVDGWAAKPGPAPLLDGTAAVASIDEIAEVLAWPRSPGGGG